MVLPCRDAEAVLGDQLDSLAAQEMADPWELIVVDNGSVDGTAELARSRSTTLPELRVVDASTRPGRHHACNVGARAAAGDAVVFVDADDRVGNGFLQAIGAALRYHEIVVPRFEYARLNGPGARDMSYQTTRVEPTVFLPAGSGAGLGIRRQTFFDVGGFDETMDFCEDMELSWRAGLAGIELHFEPEAVVHKRERMDLRSMFTQHRRFGSASAHLYRRYRDAGMPGRTLRETMREWRRILSGVPGLVRDPEARFRWIRRTGRAVGRIEGSVRHRILYL